MAVTIARLMKNFQEISKEQAQEIRATIQKVERNEMDGEAAMNRIDSIIGVYCGHFGIESFQTKKGRYLYSNTGDSYGTTILFTPRKMFIISSWGDIVEREGGE